MDLEKMSKSKYRFKGGIIGAIIGFISIIFFIIASILSSGGPGGILLVLAFPVIFFDMLLYFPICGYEGPISCLTLTSILASILGLLSLIILGFLIGWIVEKINK